MRLLIERAAVIIGDALCVGDLHIGLESRLARRGIHVDVSDITLSELHGLAELYNPKRIIIAGDLVDSMWRYKMLIRLLEKYNFPEIILVPGNHDRKPEQLVEAGIKVESTRGIIVENEGELIGIVHGHATPSEEILKKATTLIMAHVHPAIAGLPKTRAWLIDNLFDPEFLDGPAKRYRNITILSRIIVLPAFNKYLPGSKPGELATVPFLRVNDIHWLAIPVTEKLV